MGVFPIAKDVHIYPWILKVCKYVTWQWGTMVVVGFKVLIIASQFFFKSGMNSALSRWVTHDHKNSYKWQTHWKGKAYRIAFTQGHTNNKQQSRSFCYQLWIFVLIPWISPDTCLHSFTFDYVYYYVYKVMSKLYAIFLSLLSCFTIYRGEIFILNLENTQPKERWSVYVEVTNVIWGRHAEHKGILFSRAEFGSLTSKTNLRQSSTKRLKLIINTMRSNICGLHIVELKRL